MREILFRGKQDSNDKWVYGDYHTDSCYIYDCKDSIAYKVIAETVGQFTGLCDKNGTKIFEGDIVRHIQKYEISGEVESTAVIIWNEAYSCWSVKYLNGRVTAFLGCEHSEIEVISNVHDNPELLKGDDKTK